MGNEEGQASVTSMMEGFVWWEGMWGQYGTCGRIAGGSEHCCILGEGQTLEGMESGWDVIKLCEL